MLDPVWTSSFLQKIGVLRYIESQKKERLSPSLVLLPPGTGSLEAVSCDGAGKSVNTDLHEIRPPPSIFCRGQVPPWHQTKPYYEHMNHHYNTQAPDEQTQIASLYLSINTIFNLLTRRINLTHSKNQTLLPPWTRDDTTYRCNGGEIDSIL